MKAVFLGGSRRICRLNESVRAKLDELLDQGLWIFIGDANGADRAFQQHLADRGYERVVVYAVTGMLRNNVGDWKVRSVDAPKGTRGFDLYSVKDVQMANDAFYGFMLWDGSSRGTLANIRSLLARGKPVMVHLSQARRLVKLRSPDDLLKLGVASTVDVGSQQNLFFDAAGVTSKQTPAFDGRGASHSGRTQPKRRHVASARDRA